MKNAGSVPGSWWHRACGSSSASQGGQGMLGGLGGWDWKTCFGSLGPPGPCCLAGEVSTSRSDQSRHCRRRGSLQSLLPPC